MATGLIRLCIGTYTHTQQTPHLRKRRAVEEAVDETFDPLDQLPVEATKILDDSLDSSAKKRKSLAPTVWTPSIEKCV